MNGACAQVELIDALMVLVKHEREVGQQNGLKYLRALRLFRLLRLLRLLKIQTYLNLLEDHFNMNFAFLSIAKAILGLAYMTHLFGCGWFQLAVTSSEERTWLTEYDGGSGVDASVAVQYTYSIYWALMTLATVGYGDIVPVNEAERLYTLLALLIGALLFGFILSTVESLVMHADRVRCGAQHCSMHASSSSRMHASSYRMTSRLTRSSMRSKRTLGGISSRQISPCEFGATSERRPIGSPLRCRKQRETWRAQAVFACPQ